MSVINALDAARAEAAEAEVRRLRAELAAMPRPENRCHGEWPCEASTALASAEAEMARAEARAEAAEAEMGRLRADLAQARADAEATRVAAARDRDRMRGNVNAWRDRAEAAEAEAARLRAAIVEALRLASIYAAVAAHNAEAEPETAGDAWRSASEATVWDLRQTLVGAR